MRIYTILCIVFIFACIGCGGNNIPTQPEISDDTLLTRSSDSSYSSRVLWGIWDVHIDPVTLEVEAVPSRNSQFTANVTQFMQPPLSPVNMVSFTVDVASDPVNGFFVVDVTLRHPFPGMNKYNGFDVRGVLISDGSIPGIHDTDVLRAGPDDTFLKNADGLTRWWNYPEFTNYESIFGFTYGKLAPPNNPTATVNGYKYFAYGLEEETPLSELDFSGRGFFPADPGLQTRRYEIQFKMDGDQIVFDFQYAVDASWDDPDPDFAPDFPQEAFSLSANCQEAFNVSVNSDESNAWYVDPSTNGGNLVLELEIFDWQSIINPDGVPGEVAGLWLESPILGGAAVDLLASATIADGTTAVSSTYQVTLESIYLMKSGPEPLFLTIENTDPNTFQPQVAGGELFSYPDAPLAAYFQFDVMIDDESPAVQPTVLTIDPDSGAVDTILVDVAVTGADFDPSCTVELENDSAETLTIENFLYVDSGNLTFDLDLTGATIGLYDVIVTNPFASPGVLTDGFEVVELLLDIWPSTQGSVGNTGYLPNLYGPSGILSAPTWSVRYEGDNLGNALPVFLSDDTAFFSISYNYLETNHLKAIAVDLESQSILWEKTINETGYSSLCVKGLSADGSVVLVYDWPGAYSYGLDAETGDEVWGPINCVIGSDLYSTNDLDGNFIIPRTGSGVLSVDPSDGTINWSSGTGNPWYCSPAVGPDGTIYVTDGSYRVRALDPDDGSSNWSSNPYVGLVRNSITVDENGNIIMIGANGLYCFTDNGSTYSQKWFQPYPMSWYASVAVGPDGFIFYIDGNGTLRKIDPEYGSTVTSTSGWEDYAARPAIGADGLIYTNNGSSFRCFNTDLSQRWSYYTFTGSYWSAPALGQDGTVYSVMRNLGLCAWSD